MFLRKKSRQFYRRFVYHPWVVGLVSLFWFLLRTGTKPRRAVYPCQKVALANSLVFFGGFFAPLTSFSLFEWLKKKDKVRQALILVFLLTTLPLTLAGVKTYKKYQSRAQQLTHRPLGLPQATPFNRVVRVHASQATSWDFSAEDYWSYVDEATVNVMVDRGVTELTSQPAPQEAWRQILSTYQSGDQIAVKINGNNFDDCCLDNLNPLPQVAKAVARGLVSIGVPQDKIVFYEAGGRDDHGFLPYYVDSIREAFPNVRFASTRSSDQDFGAETTGYAYDDPSAKIQYSGSLSTDTYLAEVLVQSQHLINIALFRDHHEGGEDLVTGALKNHYGSIGARPSHDFQKEGDNNPIADVNNNSHIKDKTRLILIEGLFGTYRGGPRERPQGWQIFAEGTPNSLFFAFDPVAADSVIADYIIEEHEKRGRSYTGHYTLHYAAENLSLGIHEHKSVSGQYSAIDYLEVDLEEDQPIPTSTPSPMASPTPTQGLNPCQTQLATCRWDPVSQATGYFYQIVDQTGTEIIPRTQTTSTYSQSFEPRPGNSYTCTVWAVTTNQESQPAKGTLICQSFPIPTSTPAPGEPTPTAIPTIEPGTPTPTTKPPPAWCQRADVNGDGAINARDYFAIVRNYARQGKEIPGDLNQDQIVNALDLSLLLVCMLR